MPARDRPDLVRLNNDRRAGIRNTNRHAAPDVCDRNPQLPEPGRDHFGLEQLHLRRNGGSAGKQPVCAHHSLEAHQTIRHGLCMAAAMRFTLPLALLLAATTGTVVATPSTTTPNDLLGRPFTVALELYGPPDRGDGTTGVVHWRWRDTAGGHMAVAVHADLILGVIDRRKGGKLHRRAIPATGHYPGQPIAELLKRLGNPDRVAACPPPAAGPTSPGPGAPTIVADAILSFGKKRLLIAAGRVLGHAPMPAPAYGPR